MTQDSDGPMFAMVFLRVVADGSKGRSGLEHFHPIARRLKAAMTPARRVLSDVFGFAGFRRGQEAVIEALLAGRDALAVMPTGSGKLLCFQIPALVMNGLTVVVSPLVALMQDQVAAPRLAGVAGGA